MPSHAGQLLYQFSRPFNLLDFDPSYPGNPQTIGDYIRKFRKDKGLMIRELASKLGVTEDTVINWEVRGRIPSKNLRMRLNQEIEGAENWLHNS